MYDTVHPGSLDGDRYQDSSLIGAACRMFTSIGWRQPVWTLSCPLVRSSIWLKSFSSRSASARPSGDAGATVSMGSMGVFPLTAMPSLGKGCTGLGGSASVDLWVVARPGRSMQKGRNAPTARSEIGIDLPSVRCARQRSGAPLPHHFSGMSATVAGSLMPANVNGQLISHSSRS